MRWLKYFLVALAFVPFTAQAVTTIPWSITNLTDTFIFPNLVNGSAKGILVSASSTINANLSVSTLTAGNCVQAGVGGVLTTIAGACGTSGGSITAVTATNPLFSSGGTSPNISTIFSTTSTFGIGIDGFVYTNHAGLPVTAASSSFFGYTPVPPTRSITVNGTANQVSVTGGTQDFSADRTWTAALTSHTIFPSGGYESVIASTTNATTTNFAIIGAASNCNGTNALTTNSTGVVGCTAQPQGTVTAVSVSSTNGFAGSSSGGATPALTLTTTITGLLKGNGTAISAASNGTDFTLITANTCSAGQFFQQATAAGVFTCGTPSGGNSFGWPFTPVSYGNATGTLIGFTNGILVVGSSTIVGNATTTGMHAFGNVRIPSLGIAAGQFAAFDPNGVLIGTTTPINTGGSSEGVQWATAAVLGGTPTYSNGTAGVGATLTEVGTGALAVDGNSPASGDRVLVKNQASAFQNGIYTVTVTGSGIASYVLTRATDYNSNTEITPGLTTYVINGTANLDTNWAVNFTVPLTMGTTNLNYTEVSGGGAAVTSVSNSDSTLTISPTAGNVVASLNLGHANVWSALQQFGNASSTLFSAGYASTTQLVVSGQSGCASFTSGVLTGTGVACGSGSGSAFPFTPALWGNATGTVIGFQGGLFSTGSSTFSGPLHLSTLNNGTVNVANTIVYSTATTTQTLGSGLSTTGALGAFIGGTAGTLSVSGLAGSNFSNASANTVFGNPTGVSAAPQFFATSTLFTGTTGQNAFFNGSGLLVGTSTIFTSTASNVGIGTAPTGARLEILGTTTNATGNAFIVWDSTASNVFQIANNGSTTISKFGACNTTRALTTDSSGNITCGAITGGAGVSSIIAGTNVSISSTGGGGTGDVTINATGGGGGAFSWTPTQNFGINTNATSTKLSLFAGLFASSTATGGIILSTPTNITNAFSIFNAVGTNVYNIDTTSLAPKDGIGTSTPFATLSVVGNGTNPIFAVATTTNNGLPNFEIDSIGHIISSGAAPTIGTCSGFAVTAGSNDTAGTISLTSGTSCSIVFANAYATAPVCVMNPGSANSTGRIQTTTTGLTATFTTANTSFKYICIGTQ